MTESGKAHILCIEDDAGQASLLQKALERQGHSLSIACSGDEGLTLLAQHDYDLLILDYSMPGCSGMDVLRNLRRKGNLTPIIMLTGNGNEKVAVESLKAGASDYIVKDPEMGYMELLPMIVSQVMQQELLLRERERMRAAVRESEERYRKLVELSPDGIAINSGGRFVFVNPAAKAIFAASKNEELLGRQVLDFVHPECRAVLEERLAIFGRERAESPFIEERFIRLDGVEVDVEFMALPFSFRGEKAIQMIFRDVTERRLARQRLEYLAKFDTLTSLPNRALFFDRINRLLDNGKRYPQMLALLFLDLDHFKEVNDQYGHDVGDHLLSQVAVRLTGCLRESDSVARIGGDEFAVILSRIGDLPDAELVARKIITSLSAPFSIGMHICSIGASIGISIFPCDATDADSLLQKADAAMYCAKGCGRNCFRFSAGECQ